jgi:hypothetical protein
MSTINDQLLQKMIDIAILHLKVINGMDNEEQAFDYIKGLIKDSTIVFGVYRDDTEPCWFRVHIIKGLHKLRTVITDDELADAIPCRSFEEAIVLELKLGDRRLKTN